MSSYQHTPAKPNKIVITAWHSTRGRNHFTGKHGPVTAMHSKSSLFSPGSASRGRTSAPRRPHHQSCHTRTHKPGQESNQGWGTRLPCTSPPCSSTTSRIRLNGMPSNAHLLPPDGTGGRSWASQSCQLQYGLHKGSIRQSNRTCIQQRPSWRRVYLAKQRHMHAANSS